MQNRRQTFAETIRTARKALDPPLTQEGLAERLRIKQPAVSAWELGNAYPEMDTLEDLAKVLGLDLGELVALIAAERRAERTAAVG